MREEKTRFRDTPIYPILFMLVVSVVFVGILSTLHRSTEKGIKAYKQQSYQLQILTLFADTLATVTGKKPAVFTDVIKVSENFGKYLQGKELSMDNNPVIGSVYYEISSANGSLIGYCFDITGSGLWGTMRGLLGLTPDFKTIINFAIYDQMETPGLGARVEEAWFRNQFAGKQFKADSSVAAFVLVPEGATATGMEVRQVTGATITSTSVLKIIQSAATQFKLHPFPGVK